jgi:spore maturation protein CgeB
MPWFKDGAHDRIFNAMLQGCAVVTDSSRYLDEILTDGENAILYSLEERENLPEIIREKLRSPARLSDIASQGYCTAQGAHTWAHRAEYILKL